MRPGMQLLLRLLRDEKFLPHTPESEWLDAARVAGEENLLPWFAARMSSFSGHLPGSVDELVAEIGRQARHEAFAWSAALKCLLAAFHERKIPVIALKGPWLAERLHGDAALRSCGDLDFLVRPGDWNSVECLLFEIGFSPCGPPDCRHRRWERSGLFLEPHFHLGKPGEFDLDEEEIWKRAILSEFHGVPGWLLAPPDELQFLCVHAVYHRFERLSLPLDLHFAFQKLSLPDDRHLRAQDRNVLALCWLLAERLQIHPTVPPRIPCSQHIEAIAESLWERCMTQPGRSTAWLAPQRFYLQLKSPQSPRFVRGFRLAWLLLHRINGEDRRFAAHLHLRRDWQVRLLRPIRLLFQIAPLARSNSRPFYPLFSRATAPHAKIIVP